MIDVKTREKNRYLLIVLYAQNSRKRSAAAKATLGLYFQVHDSSDGTTN